MGLISACSKAGAAIGTQVCQTLVAVARSNMLQVFTAILNSYDGSSKGNQTAFLIGSAFAVVGALIALFVIPDVSRRLDDEDEVWKVYLAEHGWQADWGDDVSKDPKGVMMHQVVPIS